MSVLILGVGMYRVSVNIGVGMDRGNGNIGWGAMYRFSGNIGGRLVYVLW